MTIHPSQNKMTARAILATCFLLVAAGVLNAQYNGWKKNPDGSFVLGGCFDGWKQNPDGKYVLGGGYDGYM